MSGRADRRERWWTFGVGVVVLAAFLLVLPHFLERLDPLTGDEPFYVMTALSMLRDRDLDESNNYAVRDYEEFYPATPLPSDWQGWPSFPATLPPHRAVSELDGLHTKHALGLSFLIAVPYELLGRLGAVLVVMICGAALSGQMYLLGRGVQATRLTAAIVALGLAASMPLAPYALLIFPEIPAALLLLYALRRVAATENQLWQWMLAGCAVGFLPWLHQRFIPSAAVLGCVLVWRAGLAVKRRQRAVAVAALAPVALGATTLIGYNWRLYRSPFQNVEDHAGFSGIAGMLNGGYGLALDAQWGLLIAAPVFLLALAALPWWLARDRRIAVLAVVTVIPYLAVVAAYRVWWGEWGPPARYLVPIVPLAAGPLCAWLRSATVPGRITYGFLCAIGSFLTVVGFGDPQRFYHQPNGWNNLWAEVDTRTGIDLADRLVAFQSYAIAADYDRATAAILLTSALMIAVIAMYLPLAVREAFRHRDQLVQGRWSVAHDRATIDDPVGN